MRPSLLAVDLSNQVYRAIYAHPELSSNGIYTGGIYGLLSQLATAISITHCDRIIFLTDRKPYVRQKDYADYKAGRSTLDEGVVEARQESMRLAGEMAEATGTPVWGVPGYEADDLAGLLCVRHRHRYELIWSMSNDTDLYQLMWCDNFRTLAQPPQQRGGQRKPPLITSPAAFAERYGIDTDAYVLALALSGTHNAVKGIPQIGEKRSLEAVRDKPGRLRELQDKHADLIARNIGLITLPHPSLPKDTPVPVWSGFDVRALYKFCDAYDINLTAAMVSAFGRLETA